MRKRNFFLIVVLLALQIGLLSGPVFAPSSPAGILRLLVAGACVLYLPGYALLAALLPRPASLNGVQRLAISCAGSVAILPVIALILSPLPWGLHPWPMAIAISIFTLITALVGISRYARLSPEDRRPDNETGFRAWWQTATRASQAFFITMLVAVILGLLVTFITLTAPRPDTEMTEFYITGPQGIAEIYPLQARPGEILSIRAAIGNHEGRRMTYSVLVTLDGATLQTMQSIDLDDGQTWEGTIDLLLPDSAAAHRVELLLLCEGQPVPCRALVLHIDVR